MSEGGEVRDRDVDEDGDKDPHRDIDRDRPHRSPRIETQSPDASHSSPF